MSFKLVSFLTFIHCQASAMIAICQDCGKYHLVIVDACQSHDKCHRMPVANGTVESKFVTVLCNTGCFSVVVRRLLVPDSKITGQVVLCVLIVGTICHTLVAEIFVDTPYCTGPATAVCTMNPNYDLIVGNIRGAVIVFFFMPGLRFGSSHRVAVWGRYDRSAE